MRYYVSEIGRVGDSCGGEDRVNLALREEAVKTLRGLSSALGRARGCTADTGVAWLCLSWLTHNSRTLFMSFVFRITSLKEE